MFKKLQIGVLIGLLLGLLACNHDYKTALHHGCHLWHLSGAQLVISSPEGVLLIEPYVTGLQNHDATYYGTVANSSDPEETQRFFILDTKTAKKTLFEDRQQWLHQLQSLSVEPGELKWPSAAYRPNDFAKE